MATYNKTKIMVKNLISEIISTSEPLYKTEVFCINTQLNGILFIRRDCPLILTYKKNLGTFDRLVRAGIGLYLLWLVLSGSIAGWWAFAAFLFAMFHLIESSMGY
jgi:hypothetical protein